MKIKTLLGMYNSNTHLCIIGKQVVIIDSGAPLSDVIAAVGKNRVVAVLVTHEHFDHLTNCVAYALHFKVPVYGTREVLDNLKYYREQLPSAEEAGVYYPIVGFNNAVTFNVIADERVIDSAGIKVQPYICQGHSAGSLVYQIGDALFTGDLLFARGVGNVFMTNGKRYLFASLARVKELKYTMAYHGHGVASNYQDQQKNIQVWLKWLAR